jgi:hypothetical protein
LYWLCGWCNVGVAKWRTELQSVKMSQGKMEEEMEKMRKEWEEWKKGDAVGCVKREVEKLMKDSGTAGVKGELEKLKKENVEAKKQIAENKKNVEMAWKDALEKKEVAIKKSFLDIVKEQTEKSKEEGVGSVRPALERRDIRMEVIEELEREKRRDKLVIMGIPEEGEDGGGTDNISDVVNGLMDNVAVEFVVIGRIGIKGTGPTAKARPVRIKVQDATHRRRLLANAKELKKMEGMERIYIVPDLTRMQQDADRKLREEVRTLRRAGEVGVKIVRGIIVKSGEERVVDKNDNNLVGEVPGASSQN